jgi:hypothetical protein
VAAGAVVVDSGLGLVLPDGALLVEGTELGAALFGT